jgi:hypothetical protein
MQILNGSCKDGDHVLAEAVADGIGFRVDRNQESGNQGTGIRGQVTEDRRQKPEAGNQRTGDGGSVRHCEERSDVAVQRHEAGAAETTGLLHCIRKDG